MPSQNEISNILQIPLPLFYPENLYKLSESRACIFWYAKTLLNYEFQVVVEDQ
jgi:hypothetical protein